MDEIDLEGLDEIDEEELADILRYPPNVRVTMKEHIDTPLAQLSASLLTGYGTRHFQNLVCDTDFAPQ